jgi:integrase
VFHLAVMWGTSLKAWTQFLEVTGLSSTTIRSYRRLVVNFLADRPELLDATPGAVTENDVVSYVAELPRNGAMRGMVLRALRSFYAFAEDDVPVNPTKRLKPKNPRYAEAPDLTDDELARAFVALASREPRRAWACLFIFGTGARIASACAVEQRDLAGGRVRFRVTKGDRPYTLPLGPIAQDAVDELVRGGRRTLIGVSPTRVRQWLEQASWDTGLHLHPHLLRHAFASRIARATDPGTVREMMNWADLSQYPRYVHSNEERKRAAVAAI